MFKQLFQNKRIESKPKHKIIPTMEEENDKRMSIGYPYLLEVVK